MGPNKKNSSSNALAHSGKMLKGPNTPTNNDPWIKEFPMLKKYFSTLRNSTDLLNLTQATSDDLNLIDVYDPNMLVASWIDDLGFQQKEQDDKFLFFNNESILTR
mmetsp:Transcript_13243/g.20684  ORF Transcript_13243/g.20684 Transcript_13243/m.20684 type:complete len:105 (+) Transcript_13243:436-750(+)